MKRTYTCPTISVVEIEVNSIYCTSGNSADIPVETEGRTDDFDAPRTRLWGED